MPSSPTVVEPSALPTIALLDERLRTTSICLAVRYGSRDDPAEHGGLAHLLEHTLMSAPLDGNPSFCEQVERLGGHANAETGLDIMLFYAQVHADDADTVARLLHQAVLRPELTDAVLDTERDAVLQELAAAQADPGDVVQDAFLARLFPGHPLGRPVGGDVEQIRRISLLDVLVGHRTRFLTSAMTLVVIGPRLPRLDGLGRTVPAAVPPPAQALPPLAGPTGTVTWPDEYGWVCVGARSSAADDAGRRRFAILAQLLGDSPSSPLYRRLRNEAGLAYSFACWDRGYQEAGAWRVLVGVEPGNGETVVAIVREILAELASAGPDPDDLAAARRQAGMRLILDSESPLDQLRMVAQRTRAGTAEWSLAGELAALDAVDAEQVRAAAAEVLGELTVVVRPEAS
ncbi:M16 family metallopeptidase [Streptomyces melanogenes]|uniref:M16 family metallopeptidase n=1 Tax=Streptomyces melanogenes TaxID=67326 RepID=UPI00167F0320|nr:pitrilysin family protein [Streptomyces melanogenes]GGP85365.1 peptidase M16 [Streptomyces melanogenes]